MLSFRKRSAQTSIFRSGAATGVGVSGVLTAFVSFYFTIIAEPGDTIFINLRASGGLANYAPGWTTIGNVAGLFSAVHVVTTSDTGTYEMRWGSNASNAGLQYMVCAGTYGWRNTSLTSFSSALVCTLPPISILKNSTVLVYHTTVGGQGNVTARTIAPSGYVLAVSSTIFLESRYKIYGDDISDGFTLTWTPGPTPPVTTRISRVEILGAT